MVTRCITAVHQTFGARQILSGPNPARANEHVALDIDVVLVTTATDHLVDALPQALFSHRAVGVPPRTLGFACHKVMQYHATAYDRFAYLEDDIEVTDALLFDKLDWFGALFGDDALLQPNRFELADDLDIMKLYVDGGMTDPAAATRFQDTSIRPRIEADAFGRRLAFQRVDNVHAGCFFLGAGQMRRLATQPGFGLPTDAFVGPLESAATLPLMQSFEVYKPARENAAFLEVRHLGRRFLAGTGPEPCR